MYISYLIIYIDIIIYYFNSVILSTNDKFLNKIHGYTNIVTIKKKQFTWKITEIHFEFLN